MIKEAIGTGKTIEEATENAKALLNAPETAFVSTEVIQMPKKKVLGLFGGADAQVKVSFDDGKKPPKKKAEKPAKKTSKPAQKPEKAVKTYEAKPETSPKKEEDVLTEGDVDLSYACNYLETIIKGLKIDDAKVSAKVADGVVEMEVDCENYGIIIGRRGETLDALQYLTGLALKNCTSKYVRVTINVGDYRAKREETLKALAVKNANYVLRTGRRYTFEPMNPYERRIIHTAIQEVEGVTSRSVGSGMDRKVVIEPEGGVRRSNGGNRRRGNAPKAAPADPNREKHVDRADIPKFGKIEVNKPQA
ncbi:MAG: Jag N-terminal domain-containing protein [Eubacterium sp.]|nr:Jag N-terminal domain-containing protein [Eubacterium sp.]